MLEITQQRTIGSASPALAVLRFWLARSKSRRRLAKLDAEALADVGITDAQRQQECAKWFWED